MTDNNRYPFKTWNFKFENSKNLETSVPFYKNKHVDQNLVAKSNFWHKKFFFTYNHAHPPKYYHNFFLKIHTFGDNPHFLATLSATSVKIALFCRFWWLTVRCCWPYSEVSYFDELCEYVSSGASVFTSVSCSASASSSSSSDCLIVYKQKIINTICWWNFFSNNYVKPNW